MLDKDALLKAQLAHRDVELPSGLGTVRVRGLTRQEAVEVQRGVEESDPDAPATLEVRALARGMVEPALTEDEAVAWRNAGLAADVAAAAKMISDLSNMDERAGKGPTSSSRRTKA